MAGIEAYVDLIPEFAALAGQIQKGVEKAVKKVDASVPFTAAPDFGELVKDADKAASKAATQVDFGASSSFDGVVKDAGSAASKAAAQVDFTANASGLNSDVKAAAKKAAAGADATIELEVDTSGADSKLGKLGDKGKEAGSAFGEEFSGQAMDGIGAGKLAGKAGWVGLAVTAAGIFAEGFVGAMDQKDMSAHMQASMGLSPAEAKKYASLSSKIFAENYGASIEDVNAGIASVKGNIRGLNDVQLGQATREALTYADTFGIEVGEATVTAASLIKNNLAGSTTEAFDLMTRSAQQAGPQMTEPLMEAVDEYGKHFGALGFGGDEAMGILANAARDGEIGIDKAGDAVKEFQIRATDLGDTAAQDALKTLGLNGKQVGTDLLAGGDTAKKATDDIVTGLLGIKNPAKQAEATMALFGTPIEDMGKDKIPAFLDALESGDGALTKFQGATQKAGDALSSGPSANIEKFKRTMNQGLVNFIGGKVLPGLSKFGGFLSREIPDAWSKLTGAISGNEDFQVIGSSLQTIGSSLLTFFGHVGDAARRVWEVIGPTIGKLFENLKTTVGGVLGGLVKSLSGWVTLIAGLLSGDTTKIKEGVGKIFGGLKDVVVSIFKGLFNSIGIIVGDIAGVVGKKFTELKDAAGKKAGELKDAAVKKFTDLKDAAGKKVTDLKDGVVSGFTKAKDGAVKRATDLKDGVVGKFTSLKDSAGKKVTDLKTNLTTQFTKTRDNAATRMQELKDKATSKLTSLKDWGTGKFSTGWAKMKGVLGGPADAAKKKFSDLFGEGGSVRRIFNGLVTAAKSIFGKLKSVIAVPVNAMIDKINTGLIRDGINFLLKKVVPKEQQAKVLLPWIPHMATGGRVRGPGTPTSDDVPIMGSRDEFMVKAKSARSVGYDTMSYINDTGMLPPQQFLAKGGRVWPTNTRRLSNNYAGHSGVDIAAAGGAPIFAPEAGKITYTGWGRGYGQAIFEQFQNGLQAVFGHTSKVLTKQGASVDAGQLLGLVGSTGRSTGNHLHFEVNSPSAFGSPANRAASMSFLNGANIDGSGGGGGVVSNIWANIKDAAGKIISDPLKWITSKVTGIQNSIGGSPFMEGLSYIPGFLMGKAKEWLTSKVTGGGDGESATWSAGQVGNLGPDQLNNAATIIATARRLGFGDRGAIIGLMTAMQESTLRNLSYGDRDSVGLFQQRAPWGSFADRTNPAKAAAMFFQGGQGGQPGLGDKNWRGLSLNDAAQAVQVSGVPGAYAKWEGLARQLVGKYAFGGTTPRSGTSLVGENGPEFVKLPGASTVSNKRETAAMFGQERITYFTIDNWEKGIGHFRTIAQEEIDQADDFGSTMTKMRGR